MRSLLLCLLAWACTAEKYEFEPTVLELGTPKLLRTVAMYTHADAPEKSNKANNPKGESYIKIKLDFTSTQEMKSEKVVTAVMQAHTLDFIGTSVAGGKRYCCSQEEDTQGLCKIGDLIIHPQADVDVQTFTANFEGSKTTTVSGTFNVKHTGQHLLVVASCEAEGKLTVSGTGVWMNPYGYLSGQVYGFMAFYGNMALLYLAVGLVWFIFNCMYFKEVFALQNCVAAALGICMVEMATWYFDYEHLNKIGTRNSGAIFFGIFTSSVRKAISRMLILAVSFGWGVVKPSLGPAQCKITALGGVYFIFEFALEMVVRWSHHREVNNSVRMFLALPVSICNAIFYWWIFVTLYRLIAKLEARNQAIKLQLYKRFTNVLIASLLASVGFAIYQMYFLAKKKMLTEWNKMWILDGGFEEMAYSAILFVIAFLWRPSNNSRRYAYAQVGVNRGEEDDFGDLEDNDIPLSNINHRMATSQDDEGPEPKFTVDVDSDDGSGSDDLVRDVTGKID